MSEKIRINIVKNVFEGKQWITNAWKLFKKKPLTWIFMLLIFNLFVIIGNSFFIGRFIVALLLPVLAGGIFIALDKSNRDEPIGLENLFSIFKDKPVLKQLLHVGLISMAVVALTMIFQYLTGTEYTVKVDSSQAESVNDVYQKVTEGSVFTSIISWVWSCALLFGIPLIVINKEPVVPALKHSLYGLLVNIAPFLVFFGMIILLVIVSLIPVGLGLLILIPILFGAFHSAFKEIYIETDKEEISAFVAEIVKAKEKEEKDTVVYTNNKKHQETDLKETYHSIRVFRMVGMALVTIGLAIAGYSYYSLQVGTNTIGEVLSVETHRSHKTSGGSSTSYTPMFSFKDKNGEQRTAPTSYASSSLNYPVGVRVKINYDPDDFSTVRINSVGSIFYIPMFFWLFGGALVWMTKKMKKDVDENGVPPRKSLFLKDSSESSKVSTEDKVSVQPELIKQEQDQKINTEKSVEFNLPKKFTLNFYEEYMHITLSWFGVKTITATFMAGFSIVFLSVFLFSDSSNATITGSPLMIKLIPWISAISGAGILYYTLTTWLNKTHIFVSQDAIEIKHKPLPWFGNKRLETKNIKQLYSKEEISTSSSNNRRSITYKLHIVSHGEDDMTLLSVENSQQALFLEQEIEKYLGIENMRVRGEIG